MRDFDALNPGDMFDSRDVIEKWEELEKEHDSLQDAIDEAASTVETWQNSLASAERDAEEAQRILDDLDPETDGYGSAEIDRDEADAEVERLRDELAENEEALKDAEKAMEEWTEYEEYAALKEFVEEAENAEDWIHGATFIADDYFEDYAREFAEDIGAVKRNMEWPCNCIDWEAAAHQLKSDYTSYTLNGKEYWCR